MKMKIFPFVSVLIIVSILLTGCGAPAVAPAPDNTQAPGAAAPAGEIKIGMTNH